MHYIIFGLSIGFLLSLDAFMVGVLCGTSYKRKKHTIYTSIYVAVFHFMMPLIGFLISKFLFDHINISTKIITIVVLIFLSVQMFLEKNDEEEKVNLSSHITKIGMAFSVSIDSFFVGFTLIEYTTTKLFIIISLIAFTSGTLSLIALNLGKEIKDRLSHIPVTKIASILLLVVALLVFFDIL